MAHNAATTTNGGTLEDCHTNIFVLTELNGLRWCRFSSNNSSQVCTEIGDDPVLCAYGKCLKQSLLCVWRRVPPNNLPPYGSRVDLRLTSDKELWVFWYGEEPDWNSVNSNNALTRDEGGGSWDKGVEYDTRCLLFKALHNLIERCLLTRDFIRLGRWFVRPLNAEEATTDSSQASHVMAFSFSFFVHGENNVCVSVNVQSQPAVFRLSREHLNSLSASATLNSSDVSNKRTVILAPWSLKGVLNVEDLLKNDVELQTRKRDILSEWSNFYPFSLDNDNVENMGYVDPVEKDRQDQAKANSLPRIVEVAVGGVRLQYPSRLVVLPSNVVEGGADKCEKSRSNSSRNCSAALNTSVDSVVGSPESPKYDSTKFQKRIVERTEEELTLLCKKSQSLSQCQPSANAVSSDAGLNAVGTSSSPTNAVVEETPVWNFVVTDANNAQKDSCHCSNTQQSASSVASQLVPNKAQLKFYPPHQQPASSAGGSRKTDRLSKLLKLGVFHRRSATALFSSLPATVTGFNRVLPNLLSDLVTNSTVAVSSIGSQQQHQQVRDLAVTLPLLTNTNGIEAISRPSSRSSLLPMNNNSSIQMISPAAAPPANVNQPIDSVSDKPAVLINLDRNSSNNNNVSGNGNSLSSTSSASDRHEVETTRTADGNDVFIIKRTITKRKRLTNVSKRRPHEHRGDVRILDNLIDLSGDETLDAQSLYAPDIFITKENCAFNDQQRKKFKLWSLPMADVSLNNKRPLLDNHVVENPLRAIGEICVKQEFMSNEGVSPSHFESLTPDGPSASFNGIPNSAETPATYQTVVNDYVQMPDNIMEDDSSSGISGNDDESASNFLSPPPSHGHEEEVILKKTKPSNVQSTTTSLAPSTAHFNSQTTLQSQTKSTLMGGPSGADFTVIYPTPPSVDCNVQFSPECPAGAPSWYHGADNAPTTSHAFAGPSCFARSAYDGCDLTGNGVDGKIVQRPITAKYLAGGKFGSLTSAKFAAYFTSNKRRPDEYRPKLPLSVNASFLPSSALFGAQHPQSSFPLHASVGGRAQQPIFHSPVQPLPPPPYSARSISYSGGASASHWSSPPSVRPIFAEQSPMMLATNSPMSGNVLVRTPRTPATADLQSPLSNASSHYGRNVGSIDFNSVYTGGQSPEGHSLLLALLLCETFVDLHKDVIFDSCPLCVCSTNIQGSEMGLYVPSTALSFCDPHNQLYQNSKCSCGFSAGRHRYLSYKTGLFYEDEYESCGVWRCRAPPLTFDDKRSCLEVIELLRHQSLTVDLTRSISCTQSLTYRNDRTVGSSVVWNGYALSDLELNDFADLCNVAMEQACMVSDCTMPTREDMRSKSSLVYSWGFLKSLLPVGNAETMSLIRSLLPILQESVQKPRGNWNAKYKVEGPLTWRQFHRKCSTNRFGVDGRDDFSGPEPIPLLLAAAEREWITTSPFALKLSDRLSLETYGQPKDVIYIVVTPDNQLILQKTETFFRELSKVYEGLRLGRHWPCCTEALKNGGIMTVGNSPALSRVKNERVDAWFDQFNQCVSSSSKRTLGARLKAYFQMCQHYVAAILTSNLFERLALQKMRKENHSSSPVLSNDSAMPPPPAPNTSGLCHETSFDSPGSVDCGVTDLFDIDSSPLPHVVVIYMVNCFTYGADTEDEVFNRLVSTGLFRSYLEMFKGLPENVKGSLQLQVVPLQSILEFSLPNDSSSTKDFAFDIPSGSRTSLSQFEYFRELALNVFAQSRNVGLKSILSLQAKPLTSFGPAASRIELIKKKMERTPNAVYQINCPQIILAPTFEHTAAVSLTNNSGGDSHDDSVRVLFLTYCLSEKQRWLLAAATDQQGALLENCVISLDVQDRSNPNIRDRWCASRGAIIKGALNKLFTFACSLMATGCQPWRLIVGRMGRIGHEELKAWTHLLSKNQLRYTSRLLREHCTVCLSMPDASRLRDNHNHDTPSLLSACLVATETDSHFRVFSDSFSYDERFGQNAKQCPLSTPDDVSCTHIMVFPTSASIQMNQPGSSNNGPGDEPDIEFFGKEFFDADDADLTALLNDNATEFQRNPIETADDNIQQQPLALGYTVSTAPVDFASDWFWSSCPSAKYVMPAFLRSSLHINTNGVQQNEEQILAQTIKSRDGSHGHPLDSSVTTDVLRYVLETYNALSWLNLEPTTGDRKSCLPHHMQALCRLYKAVEELL